MKVCLHCGVQFESTKKGPTFCSDKCTFLDKVIKTEVGCWGWGAHTNEARGGYGYLRTMDGRTRRAHRVSWEIHNGPIPTGMMVLHDCDNPPCTNPDHLFLGTGKDNSDDMHAKGRNRPGWVPGVKNGNSILNDDIVRQMRFIYSNDGLGYKKIAKKFSVSRSVVRAVIKRQTWDHVN